MILRPPPRAVSVALALTTATSQVLRSPLWSAGIGAFFLGGVQRGKYSDVNALFNSKRVDNLYDVTAGVTWSFAKGWSLRPQLVYYKNKSNLTLFEYDRTDASINLRADF